MAYEIYLPKDKDQREYVLNRLIEAGEQARRVNEVQWWLVYHYLRGARDFKNINYLTGTVDVGYENSSGTLQFRYDDIVSKFQAQIGRLLRIDLSPSVKKRGIGLEGLRKASIAQVALDHAFPTGKVEELKLGLFAPLTRYGTLGLAVWNEGENVGIDVVMPWEIVPIPPNPAEQKDRRGVARVRIVPLDWVKNLDKTPAANTKVWSEVEVIKTPVGELTTASSTQFTTFLSSVDVSSYTPSGFSGGTGATKKKDKTQVDTVKFVEVWMQDSMGYLARYEILAGGKLLHSMDYAETGVRIYMPIQIIQDIDVGGFWGRSFVSLLMPMNMELEYTIGRTFQNIQDTDSLGILCEPTTLGMPTEIFRSSDGIKRVRFEPDYSVPDLKPFTLAPVNMGTLPTEVVKMGAALGDKIANQPAELMSGGAPGRVDSQAGLGFLYEVSNTPLTPTAASVSMGVSNCYRAMLNILQVQWPKDKMVQVTLLDDSLAGITLDPSAGTMSLTDNDIPHPDEITISIKAMLPKSKEQEKMELLDALKTGTIDMFEFHIMVRKKGLELPVGNEGEWQNYRRSMMENLMLFGDGQKPAEVILDLLDIHDVHLRILQAFMARPEFYQASAEVREAFKQHYNAHLQLMGVTPEQTPFNEEAATEAQVMEKLVEGQMRQGGGPPTE